MSESKNAKETLKAIKSAKKLVIYTQLAQHTKIYVEVKKKQMIEIFDAFVKQNAVTGWPDNFQTSLSENKTLYIYGITSY